MSVHRLNHISTVVVHFMRRQPLPKLAVSLSWQYTWPAKQRLTDIFCCRQYTMFGCVHVNDCNWKWISWVLFWMTCIISSDAPATTWGIWNVERLAPCRLNSCIEWCCGYQGSPYLQSSACHSSLLSVGNLLIESDDSWHNSIQKATDHHWIRSMAAACPRYETLSRSQC